MTQDLSTRIASRADTLENWTAENPILLVGEVAVVFDGDNQLFKVGDGTSNFNDLPFSFYQQFASELINTSMLKVKNMTQGYASEASGIGDVATGYKSQVSSNFAQAHGYQAKVSSDFGYVWNGDNVVSTYTDHGPGTFNINSRDGLSGVYMGNDSVADILSRYQKKTIFRDWTE